MTSLCLPDSSEEEELLRLHHAEVRAANESDSHAARARAVSLHAPLLRETDNRGDASPRAIHFDKQHSPARVFVHKIRSETTAAAKTFDTCGFMNIDAPFVARNW
jgi:hypothetical protein